MMAVCCVVSLAAGIHLLSIPNHPVTIFGMEVPGTAGWAQPIIGAALVVCGGSCLWGMRGE